jgi:hypothetical protein
MRPGRWRHIAATYAELGILPTGFSLEGFLLGSPAGPSPGDSGGARYYLSPRKAPIGVTDIVPP